MMRAMKKLISVMLAIMLAAAMAVPAMAAEGDLAIRIKAGNSGIDISQKTFQAYRILDATVAPGGVTEENEKERGISYSVPENGALKAFYKDYFKGEDGSKLVTANPDSERALFDSQVVEAIAALNDDTVELQKFAKAALTAVKDQKDLKAGTGASEDSDYVIRDLELGYYLIQDTTLKEGEQENIPISALALDSVKGGETTIEIKAMQPTIDKKIEEANEAGGTTSTDHNQAAIGDTVNYVLTSKVPDMTGYEKYYFIVKDTLSEGLTFSGTSEEIGKNITVQIGETQLNYGEKSTISTSGDYYVEVNGGIDEGGTPHETTIKIVFHNFLQWKEKKGADITIKYSAVLNKFAEIGTTPNKNSVKLQYSNDPNTTGEGDDEPGPNEPIGETPDAKTYTYVTGLKIQKVDGDSKLNDGSPMPLKGAEFTITGKTLNIVVERTSKFVEDTNGSYYKLKNGTYTQTPWTEEYKDQYVDATRYRMDIVSEEKERPAGTVSYTMTTGDDGILHFDGLSKGTYTITETKAPDGYNMLTEPLELKIAAAFETAPEYKPSWSATLNGKADKVSVDNGIITISVENKKGTLLPSTGGTGTKLLYLLGGVLVIGAGALLVLKKRGDQE